MARNDKLCPLYDYSEIVPIVPAVEILEPEDITDALLCTHDSDAVIPATTPTPTAPSEEDMIESNSEEDLCGDSSEILLYVASVDDPPNVSPNANSEDNYTPASNLPAEEQRAVVTRREESALEPAVLVASGVLGCLVLGPTLATTAVGVGALCVYTQREREEGIPEGSNASNRVPDPPLSDQAFVVHRVHRRRTQVATRGLDRIGKAAYWVIEKMAYDKRKHKEPREKVVGAGVTTGIIGLLLGGPICGAVAGFGAAVACRREGFAGDTARAVGEVALSARDKAKAINHKHQVVKKSKIAVKKAWKKAKQVEDKHNVLDRTKRSVVRSFRVTTMLLKDQVVAPVTDWVARGVPRLLKPIGRNGESRNQILVNPILGIEHPE